MSLQSVVLISPDDLLPGSYLELFVKIWGFGCWREHSVKATAAFFPNQNVDFMPVGIV